MSSTNKQQTHWLLSTMITLATVHLPLATSSVCTETDHPLDLDLKMWSCDIGKAGDLQEEGLPDHQALRLNFTPGHTIDFTTISVHLANVEYLEVDMSHLSSVQLRQALGSLSLPSLQQLRISRNMEQDQSPLWLESHTFHNMGHVTNIDMKGIGIGILDRDALSGLTSLRELDLSENYLQEIEDAIFTDCKNLTTLRLQKNFLESGYLTPGSFSGPTDLHWLNLEDNPLGQLPENLFSHLTNLSALFLTDTHLFSVHDGAFQGLSNLHYLSLSKNKLRSVPTAAFTPLTSLFSLDMSNNDVGSLGEGAFSPLHSLELLYLQHNLLGDLEDGVWRGLDGLRELHLRDNQIRELNDTSLEYLPSLNYLDVSNNQLSIISSSALSLVPALTVLQLEKNMLKWLAPGTFDSVQLKELYLDNNRWHCTCDLLWLFQWLVSSKALLSNEESLYTIKCSSPEHLRLYDFYSLRYSYVMGCPDPGNTEVTAKTGQSRERTDISMATTASVPDTHHQGLSGSEIGIIVGVLLAAAIIAAMVVLLCLFCWRKKKRRFWTPAKNSQKSSATAGMEGDRERTPSWCIDPVPGGSTQGQVFTDVADGDVSANGQLNGLDSTELVRNGHQPNGHVAGLQMPAADGDIRKPPTDGFMFDNMALERSYTSHNDPQSPSRQPLNVDIVDGKYEDIMAHRPYHRDTLRASHENIRPIRGDVVRDMCKSTNDVDINKNSSVKDPAQIELDIGVGMDTEVDYIHR